MDDKTFDLLEKMYTEITKRFDTVDSRLDSMDADIKELKAGQAKIEIKLEHEIKNSLMSLHEVVADHTLQLKEHSERLTSIENKVDYISMSVTSHDKRLKVVESSRKKAK